ncbi:hypothetical protein [Streptomyces sp. NPDC047315]|uniref:hypothetical protein n=1 Tax=Streptomyces sp. NPDC047315 TaxID=3155142 RepID=UPI0033C63131
MHASARHRRPWWRRTRPGRHTAEYLAAVPTPETPFVPSAWSRPWTGPTKDEARAHFAREAEARERRQLVIAPHGLQGSAA